MSIYPELDKQGGAACRLAEAFEDARGVIQPLVDAPISGCALIHSNKDAIRANHYHKEDWHYTYIVSGSLAYYHRAVGDAGEPIMEEFGAGALFYSPAMVEHAMHFLEDSVLIVMSGRPREKDMYEDDVVRIPDLTGRLTRRAPSSDGRVARSAG